jgi:excisionase family DNA binding protein
VKRLRISQDARTRTPSESRQTAREPHPVPSRRAACSDHPSEILLCEDTDPPPGAGLAAEKGIELGSKSKQRNLSSCLKDLPPFMTDHSFPAPSRGGVGNRRQDRFATESIGISDVVDQIAGPRAPDESLLLDSREVERLLGIGRTKVYELIASAQIPVVRIGRCVRIPRDELKAWIASHTTVRETHPGNRLEDL